MSPRASGLYETPSGTFAVSPEVAVKAEIPLRGSLRRRVVTGVSQE
jgi:hypothetical protein